MFSPDNKHNAAVGCPNGKPGVKGFVLDGKLFLTIKNSGNHWMPQVSPDNGQLFTVHQIPGGTFRLDVDRQPATTFANDTICSLAGNREMGSDVVLTFAAVADGTLKRYRGTTTSDSDLETLPASATR